MRVRQRLSDVLTWHLMKTIAVTRAGVELRSQVAWLFDGFDSEFLIG